MNQTAGRALALAAALALTTAALTGCGSRTRGEAEVVVIENPKYQQGTGAPAELSVPAGTSQNAAAPAEDPSGKDPEASAAPDTVEQPAISLASKDNKAKSDEAKALVERAASMQDYSHAEGEDARAIAQVDDNILVLVNKTHPVTDDYKADDMVSVTKFQEGIGTDETHQMQAVAAEALYKLFDGAKEDGYDIRLRTGYRSYSYQNTLFNNYVKNNGAEAAARFSAKPGESEHQTGLCCDVGVNGVSLTGFNDRKEAVWVAEHAHEYGFILRYPKGKEDVTGYMYESWHIRYVGTAVATEIYEQGLTLEEYLGVTD